MNGMDDSFVRGRAYTWSHERTPAPTTRGLSTLSSEEFDLMKMQGDDGIFDTEDNTVQQTQLVSGKKRRKSYTEIIATAILSSPEKRLTLAEIYDWMAANVEEYRNQRYVPSSSSWKNAVRHNLSVQSCFKRVKRHGVEKPSWWTVDIRQAAKRRLSIPIFTPKPAVEETRALQKRPQTAAISDNGSVFTFDKRFEAFDEEDEDEHPYSMNGQQMNGGQSSQMELNTVITYDNNGQSVATLNLDNGEPSISVEQLTEEWLNRFKHSGTGNASGKDGSMVQTLRVKTAEGTHQNVRFAGPLKIKVVVRCEKAAQTDDLMEMGNGNTRNESGVSDLGFAGFETISRGCSIDQTLITLSNDCDISKMLHGDVRMPSCENVLSPTAVLEEDALAACWNAINGDDLMTLTNMS